MRLITLLLLLAINYSVNAEVYKCGTSSKQIVYQSIPCSANTADQNIVDIPKLDEHQKEEALNRLKATEDERQALDKVAQEKRDAAAAQWKADAPQREAEAARREAAAARQQVPMPYPSYPSYPMYPYNYNYGQRPSYHPDRPSFSPSSPYAPSFTPYPSFAPHPAPYIPPYMPFPTTR